MTKIDDNRPQLCQYICDMPSDSQLYLQVHACDNDELVIIIIERNDCTMRCSYKVASVKPHYLPSLHFFNHVIHDFIEACNTMHDVIEIEVTAISGWGVHLFEQSKKIIHDVFVTHLHDKIDTQGPRMSYSVKGHYEGTRRLGTCECQRYAKLQDQWQLVTSCLQDAINQA
jgi:hypothetical protein